MITTCDILCIYFAVDGITAPQIRPAVIVIEIHAGLSRSLHCGIEQFLIHHKFVQPKRRSLFIDILQHFIRHLIIFLTVYCKPVNTRSLCRLCPDLSSRKK